MLNFIKNILEIAPYIEIIHHISGRIRLKISFAGIKFLKNKDIQKNLRNIPGVLEIRINSFARSAIIEYDQEKLPYDFWVKLGQLGQKPDLASEITRHLESLSA
ncbi:conserved hypothetical protein [Candidatus Magnetomoraceae bacterium gMMP-15]